MRALSTILSVACLLSATRGEVLAPRRPRFDLLRGGDSGIAESIADSLSLIRGGTGGDEGADEGAVPASAIIEGEAMNPPGSQIRTYAGRASAFDVFRALEDEGQRRSLERETKLLSKSIAAGIFVGVGGTLCAGIGGDLGGSEPFWAPGNGLARFVFGAIGYPLSITLVAVTGSSAFTGNLCLAGAALRANKCEATDALKMLAITYVGCFLGTTLMGALAAFAALPAAKPCIAIVLHKLELTAIQTLLRGIGGGLLISLAITMATSAVRNEGGLFDIIAAIWLPIMTYVACDFEHCLANFFFFACAALSGGTFGFRPFLRNIALSTVGNVIGAGLIGGWLLTWANGPDRYAGEHAPTGIPKSITTDAASEAESSA